MERLHLLRCQQDESSRLRSHGSYLLRRLQEQNDEVFLQPSAFPERETETRPADLCPVEDMLGSLSIRHSNRCGGGGQVPRLQRSLIKKKKKN